MTAKLAALIVDLEKAIAEVPAQEASTVIGELERLQAICWARLMIPKGDTNRQAETPVEGDRLLSIPEVAGLLSVPRGYAYELARRGEIPTVRFGKYVRVTLTAFREYVAHHQEKRLDKVCSDRLQSTRGRLRGATNPRTVGTHASGIRQTRGGPSGNRRQVGDRRVGHSRTDGPADSASGEDRNPGEA